MQEFETQHPAMFVVCAFAGSAILWVGIGVVISLVSGWRSLAGRYRTEREFPEHKRRMQSARMRAFTGYNNILTLSSDAEGITMGMTVNLFPGHPRLFVSWADVVVEEPKRTLWVTMRTLRLGPGGIPLRLSEGLVQFLLETKPTSGGETQDGGIRRGI